MRLGRALRFLAASLFAIVAGASFADEARVALPGHLLPAIADARVAPMAKAAQGGGDAMPLTIVLRRSDEAGFQRFLRDVYDPTSPQFRRFLSAQEISERFGPSVEDYSAVERYFVQQGFSTVESSANRMTLTVNGTRAMVERALATTIEDFETAEPIDKAARAFFANRGEPTLPASIAAKVQAVAGLSSLARPEPQSKAINGVFCSAFSNLQGALTPKERWDVVQQKYVPDTQAPYDACKKVIDDCETQGKIDATQASTLRTACLKYQASSPSSSLARPPAIPPAWKDVDGAGQKIGLVQFDTFNIADVADYLELLGMPSTLLANVSSVHVAGGAAPGANQSEVLLDIDTVLLGASGAAVVAYDAPFTGAGSFQAIFNAMLGGGVTIISNSWAYCEDQTTLADVQSIDSILATAAAAGVSVFNAAGDSGSTCLNRAPNTIAVPAGSPHATAVGGTTLITGPGATYQSETWWDGTSHTPPTGQGGFGVSRFFARPSYQNAFTAQPMRSIPDVAFNSDPAQGMMICQASDGGCPSVKLYGGTSVAAPAWAAIAALLNQAHGSNLGQFNPLLYPLAASGGFHTAASMGSDFAHVGLGSPIANKIHLALSAQTAGPVSATESEVRRLDHWVAADGTTSTRVVVKLRDANGNMVTGKTVALSGNAGSHVVISPPSGVASPHNGAVVFTVTDATTEDVVLTATDTTDAVTLATTATVQFIPPMAASASIGANPTSVLNDGIATTTITVTLHDALNRPLPFKQIRIEQGAGHSIITAPSPNITDANGQSQFTATNLVSETVTYTAVDVTDGDLPVPGSAIVTFSGTANTSCVTAPPVAASGFAMTPFATGFAARNFTFGNVNWGGCPGASNPTFTTGGSVFVVDFPDGTVFKLPASGGAATNANRLSTVGPTLGQPTFGRDGKLYATRGSTGSGSSSGVIIELDPATGAVVRTLASNLTCPFGLSTDPLSGDLFFIDECFGGGSDNPSLWRLRNPGSATPTLTVYATLPDTPNGALSFSPDGTLYATTGYTKPNPPVLVISGTDKPSPPTITPIAGVSTIFWVTVAQTLPNGAAKSLITLTPSGLALVDITANPVTSVPLTTGGISSGVIGPDGCIYASASDTVFKIAPASGPCTFSSTSQAPGLALSPTVASPSPVQGSQQTITARFVNVSVPVNTPVLFTIGGANAHLRLGRTDANGRATIQYKGTFAGADRITATASLGILEFTSNQSSVTWTAGPHVSALTLNSSPSGAIAGRAVTLAAALIDVSLEPPAAIAGASIHFTAGAQSCDGVTNANGIATCSLTPPSAGNLTLTATYGGNAQHLPATVAEGFSVASAGVQRTFVASYGADTNACSIAAPCRSFAQAIAHVSAGGEVIVLDSAGYGPFAIIQPVAITAPPGVYAGISVFSGPGVVVNPGAGKVAISGLTINSLGGDVGIDVQSGDALYIDRTSVSGFPTAGLRAGTGTAAVVHVRDSTLRDNGVGADFAPLASATGVLAAEVERTRFERNATGVRFGGNATSGAVRASLVTGGVNGISLAPSVTGASAAVEIRRTTVSGHSATGVSASASGGATATLTVVTSEIVQNLTGIGVSAGGSALVTDTTISRNSTTGLSLGGGGTAVSVGDNRLVGNGADGAFTSTIPKQ